ncbi:MAG: LysM peptidoglycan-binding domain-containing protein [Chloroflexota bacterium]
MSVLNCPFLGLADDPGTCKLFPSTHNCCQRARPVEAVALPHQAAYCLSVQHFRCPVFAGQAASALPAALRAAPRRWQGWHWGAASLVAFALAVLLGVLAWQSGLPQAGLPVVSEQTPARSATSTFTLPVAFSSTPNATVTVVSTATPSLQPPTQGTFFTVTPGVCRPPAGWIVYVIRTGDTLYRLSVYYGVSMRELQSANCMADATHLVAGRSLYVPDKPSPTPALTRMPTAWVTNTQGPVLTQATALPSDTPVATVPLSTFTASAPAPSETQPEPTDGRDVPSPDP